MKLPENLSSISKKFIDPVKALLPSRGSSETHSLITTPWAWRTSDGQYVGHNGEVWVYRVLDCAPSHWEDDVQKLGLGSQLSSALYDLAETSKDLGVGIRSLSKMREVHILSITWDEGATIPGNNTGPLRDFLADTLNFSVPRRIVVLGVKLWSGVADEESSMLERARRAATASLAEGGPKLDNYSDDLFQVQTILNRYGISQAPDHQTRRQMEAWYNGGKHSDATLYEAADRIYLSDSSSIEMSALMTFGEEPVFRAPDAMWGFIAGVGSDPADVISVRCVLEPSTLARTQIRRAERRMHSQIAEEDATDDLDRGEYREKLAFGEQIERFIVSGNEPLLSDCSIVMARRVNPGTFENYKDDLYRRFGIEMRPLEMRQVPALRETLPCGTERINPFLQSVSVSMVAYAGLQSFSNLGDKEGAFLGLVDPDYAPCFLDPLAAPAANKPPAMLIAGEPGSGKTFTAQAIALQSALAGHKTIFINPKADDTLEGLTDLVPGEVVRLSQISEQGGYFDPFRFCPNDDHGRSVAAEILTQHILAVLGSRGVAGQGFTQAEEIAMTAGVRAGAAAGVRCAADAINYIEDSSVRELIFQQATDPLFALAIGHVPAESYASSGDLLLIEFDKPLDIPESGVSPAEYTRSQRLAVAAVRLCTRASLELLSNNDGGVMIVDEAWMFLQSSAGLAALQSIGRLGRSKNILPIFATQRVDDVLKEGVDMQSYLSRVLCMKLTDPREAKAALTLCGLEPTESRVNWLREAGSKYDSEGNLLRGAMGLHKDLADRHAAVMIGPFPEYARQAFSTNPEDRRARKAAMAAEEEARIARLATLEADRLRAREEALKAEELASQPVEAPEPTHVEVETSTSDGSKDLTAGIDSKWVRSSHSTGEEPLPTVNSEMDSEWVSPSEDDVDEAELAGAEPEAPVANVLTEGMDSKWTRPSPPEEEISEVIDWNSPEESDGEWNSPADEEEDSKGEWNSPS